MKEIVKEIYKISLENDNSFWNSYLEEYKWVSSTLEYNSPMIARRLIDNFIDWGIKYNNPECIYKVALVLQNNNYLFRIDELQEAIISSKNNKYIYLYAKNIKSASLFMFAKLSKYDGETIFTFLNNFESNPIELINFIKDSKNDFLDYRYFSLILLSSLKIDNFMFEDILSIYYDYICNPFDESISLEVLDAEYEELISNKYKNNTVKKQVNLKL